MNFNQLVKEASKIIDSYREVDKLFSEGKSAEGVIMMKEIFKPVFEEMKKKKTTSEKVSVVSSLSDYMKSENAKVINP